MEVYQVILLVAYIEIILILVRKFNREKRLSDKISRLLKKFKKK